MEIVFLWVLFATFSAVLASSKNRSSVGWFLLGALFGPFGLLVAFFPKLEALTGVAGESQKHKKCPFCAEEILTEAIVCKHCGNDIPTNSTADASVEPSYNEFAAVSTAPNLSTIVLVMVLVVFIGYGIYFLASKGIRVSAGADGRMNAASLSSTAAARTNSEPTFTPITRVQPSWMEWEINNALYRSKAWLVVKQGPQDCYVSQRYNNDPGLLNLFIKGGEDEVFISHAWQGTRRVTFWVDGSKKQSFQRKPGGDKIDLPESLIPSLKAGRVLYINFFVEPGVEITQAFDLSGFSNAVNGLNSSDCRPQSIDAGS